MEIGVRMKVTLTYVETTSRVWVTLTEDIDLVERLQSLLLDANLNASNYDDERSNDNVVTCIEIGIW